MTGFLQKIQFSESNILMKNLKGKQNKLIWDLHSIPTIHSEKIRNRIFFANYKRIKKALETLWDYSTTR